MTTPEVSVIIAAYRATSFISRAIDSALTQAGPSVEVIVIDDACPDGTGAFVVERYSEESRVSVVSLEINSGPSGARNAGIATARGRWIAVLDADDAFEEGRLARLVDASKDWSADVVADNVRFKYPETGAVSGGRLRVRRPCIVTLESFLDHSRPRFMSMDYGLLKPLFRADFLRTKGLRYPSHIRHGEDFMLYVDVLLGGARFVLIPEVGYQWTLRNSGQSQTRVDYAHQVRLSLDLAQRDGIRGRPAAEAALMRRAVGLQRFAVRAEFVSALRSRQFGTAFQRAWSSPRVVPSVLGGLIRRLVELPDPRRLSLRSHPVDRARQS